MDEHDPEAGQPLDERQGPGQLGGDRHDPQPVQRGVHDGRVDVLGRAQQRRIVGALAGGGDERPLEVEAQRLRPVGRRGRHPVAHPGREPRDLLLRQRRRRGQEGGDPLPEQGPGHPRQRLGIAGAVVAAPAVDVDVDEAGREERPGGPRRVPGIGHQVRDPAVLDDQATGNHVVREHEPSLDDLTHRWPP